MSIFSNPFMSEQGGGLAGAQDTAPGAAPEKGACQTLGSSVPESQTPQIQSSFLEDGWVVEVRGLSVSFGQNCILKDLNLEISQGSIVGLLGASGSGKSTLLRCLQGLQVPSRGQVHVRGKTAFMFQDFQLFPHLSVEKNLVYAPALSQPWDQVHQRARQLMQTLGIQALASAYPKDLSGGQKQRVALARSLMIQPDILLCDEPTSGLDIATVHEVEGLLGDVHAQGMTMVLASHDLPFLARICQRVIMLKEGRIVKDVILQGQEHSLEVLTACF